tara:strand:- start:2251 stop:2667 length:417 start_codon:yes stop_codon:yes gene_type:complete
MNIIINNPLTKLYNRRAIERSRRNPNESLVWMKPNTFLSLASPLVKYRKDKHKNVKNLLSSRTEIRDLPYFKVKHVEGLTFKITAHEGRHRNIYINIAYGDHLMPVRIIPENFDINDYRGTVVKLIAQQSEKSIGQML